MELENERKTSNNASNKGTEQANSDNMRYFNGVNERLLRFQRELRATQVELQTTKIKLNKNWRLAKEVSDKLIDTRLQLKNTQIELEKSRKLIDEINAKLTGFLNVSEELNAARFRLNELYGYER